MSTADDIGRISVSRDALRAELVGLELRLIEKLATKAEVAELEHRVTALEIASPPTRPEFDTLRTWQARIGGALGLLYALLIVGVPILVHFLGG